MCADDSPQVNSKWQEKYQRLTEAIGHVLEDYSLVKFSPLNIKDDESISDLLFTIDNCIQYGEDQEVRVQDFDPPEEDDGFGDSDSKFDAWSRDQGL